jgi:hypothetical protein
LSEALKSNSTLTVLDLNSNRLVASFHSNSIGNKINTEAVIKLSEALISNSSLTVLNIKSNRLAASFHSHAIQITTRLVLKE